MRITSLERMRKTGRDRNQSWWIEWSDGERDSIHLPESWKGNLEGNERSRAQAKRLAREQRNGH